MSENVQLALIIALALVVVCGIAIFVLKDKLRSGSFKVNKDGVQGGLATHEPLVTKIVGTKIKGNNNDLTASNGGQIEQTDIEGNKNQLKS